MDTIVCPHCKKNFELSDAIVHELQNQVREEERKNLKIAFEKEKAEDRALHEKKLRESFEKENQIKEKELEEIRKKEKLLEEKLKKGEEEYEKREEKIKIDAQKKAEEEQHLRLKEKDLQIEQIRKANEDLKRKIEQGSQQRQGEVLELDLEEKLKSLFPTDEFHPIPKGFEGADIWQKVKYNGRIVGSILWETKRTKSWEKDWIPKLKADVARANASESILVSQILPTDSKNFDRKDGVWITTYEHSINICRYVRFLITTIFLTKSSISHTQEDWGRVRDYMMSDSFKHRMQAHFDGVSMLKTILDSEKRTTTTRWKRQQAQIDKLDTNTIDFYEELKQIVPNLPEIHGSDTLLILDENEKNDSNTL